MRILHVIPQLSVGGATRSLAAIAAVSVAAGRAQHRVLSLVAPTRAGVQLAEGAGVAVLPASSASAEEEHCAIEDADILHLHFWHTPEVFDFMDRCRVPTRRLLWCDVFGKFAPQVITPGVFSWSDEVVVTCPATLELLAVGNSGPRLRITMIRTATDWSRVRDVRPRPHDGFVVGYIGLVDPVKMHPRFMKMSCRVAIDDVRFEVYGTGMADAELARSIAAAGAAGRFHLAGYTEAIGPAFSGMDVFGYPLSEDNYSTSDLVVQEAMYAGVPPVLFRNGGAHTLVTHGYNGLVVDDEDEYVEAIERLHANPDERRRMGAQAAETARTEFGAERSAAALETVYARLMTGGKTEPAWAPAVGSAAERFVARLTDDSPPFAESLQATEADALLAAESKIARAPWRLAGPAAGGVLHYRRANLGDPMLRLWSGLMLEAAGRPVLAVAEFRAAQELGHDHWRLSWYLARAAAAAGARDLARQHVDRVVMAAPAFQPARDLARTLALVESS